MQIKTVKFGSQELAFRQDIYESLFNGMVIRPAANVVDSEILLGDWGRYTIPGISVSELVNEIERDDATFWEKIHKAGLPMAYFFTAANEAMEDQSQYNDVLRKYYQQ